MSFETVYRSPTRGNGGLQLHYRDPERSSAAARSVASAQVTAPSAKPAPMSPYEHFMNDATAFLQKIHGKDITDNLRREFDSLTDLLAHIEGDARGAAEYLYEQINIAMGPAPLSYNLHKLSGRIGQSLLGLGQVAMAKTADVSTKAMIYVYANRSSICASVGHFNLVTLGTAAGGYLFSGFGTAAVITGTLVAGRVAYYNLRSTPVPESHEEYIRTPLAGGGERIRTITVTAPSAYIPPQVRVINWIGRILFRVKPQTPPAHPARAELQHFPAQREPARQASAREAVVPVPQLTEQAQLAPAGRREAPAEQVVQVLRLPGAALPPRRSQPATSSSLSRRLCQPVVSGIKFVFYTVPVTIVTTPTSWVAKGYRWVFGPKVGAVAAAAVEREHPEETPTRGRVGRFFPSFSLFGRQQDSSSSRHSGESSASSSDDEGGATPEVLTDEDAAPAADLTGPAKPPMANPFHGQTRPRRHSASSPSAVVVLPQAMPVAPARNAAGRHAKSRLDQVTPKPVQHTVADKAAPGPQHTPDSTPSSNN